MEAGTMTLDQRKLKRANLRKRNMIAKELRQNKEFRLRRVEDRTKLYERKNTKQILREARGEHDL